MKGLKKRTIVLIQLLLILTCLTSIAEAKNWTLRDAANIDTLVKIDDSTSALTGLNSFTVDTVERVFQQWFWYRVGPSDAEQSLDLLPKKVASSQPTPTSLQTSYTLAGQFDISALYELTSYPLGAGKASLKKTITITNTSAAVLDYHLFEYSDYDLSDADTIIGDSDNIEVHNFKLYQNGAQADGSGVTYTHDSSLPPSSYDLDDGSLSLRDSLRDIDPTNFSIPQTPYGYGSDKQFVKQWDLTIPAGQSVTFTITDSFYPTKPVTATLTSSPDCVSYGGQTSYTIAYDNLLNTAPLTENLTAVKLIDLLPKGITPANNPPTVDSVYDATANTVTWDLPNLAPGAVQQSKSLTVTVNSTTDFTNEILLVSDQAFPTRVPIQDPLAPAIITNTLCNRPPSVTDIKDASINEGSTFSVQTTASANDAGQTLTYSLSGEPAGMTISATGSISYPVAVFGVYTVTVTVTDNGVGALSASDSFVLKVNKLNKPPVISSSAPTTASITQPYSYTISATDPDGDPLTYGLTVSPDGMTMSGNVISWIPATNQTGPQAVEVFVYDGISARVYQNFTINVSSTVIKQTPVITWATPVAITYGSALSNVQLNASANVPGTFVYTPAAGTVLGAGSQTLSVTFTPTDTANYNTTTASATLTIAKAGQTVSFTSTIPASTAIGGSYTPAASATSGLAALITLDAASSGCTLASGVVTFTGAGTCVINANQPGNANYNPATQVQQSISTGKGASTVTVTGATSFTYNGSAQGPSTATVTGSTGAVTYSYVGTGSTTYAASATRPTNAGTYSVTATVAADANYNTASNTAAFTINKANATVTLGTLAFTYDGSAKAATATTTPAGLTVGITYAGSATAPTAAGNYAVAATINNANYSGSANGTLVIAKTTPVITWATPVAVSAGSTLSATQLNATANVNGSFVYSPAAGTTMNTAGNQTLSVTFSPTDTANYNNATASVVLLVTAAPVALPDGDVSGDGKVDISDALLALKMSIGLLPSTAFNLSHADVGPLRNFKPAPDGKIDIEDVIVLLLRAVGTIPAW